MAEPKTVSIHVLKRRGAPRKLADPARRQRLLEALALGTPRVHACAAAGISEDTLANELKANSDFSGAVKEAEGLAVEEALKRIRQAAQDGNWQAAAWFLERRYSQDFGRRTILAGEKEQAGMRFSLDIGDASSSAG